MHVSRRVPKAAAFAAGDISHVSTHTQAHPQCSADGQRCGEAAEQLEPGKSNPAAQSKRKAQPGGMKRGFFGQPKAKPAAAPAHKGILKKTSSLPEAAPDAQGRCLADSRRASEHLRQRMEPSDGEKAAFSGTVLERQPGQGGSAAVAGNGDAANRASPPVGQQQTSDPQLSKPVSRFKARRMKHLDDEQ